MSHLPRYESYKESGVQWLGEIPSHWVRTNIKYYYDVQLGKMLQPEAKSLDDISVKYLKAQHVQWEKIDSENMPEMWCNSKELNKYAVVNGDLLICEGGEVGRCGILTNLEEPAIIQNALHRVRNTSRADVRYLNYFIQHTALSDWFSILCNKATIAHFTSEKLLALPTLIPPLIEQKIIADFLDKRLAQVDALIAKQENLLEKLAEQRIALISHAVTKGLNPDAKFDDSCIAWFGVVPKHWTIAKLGYSLDGIGDVDHYMPESIDGSNIPYVMTGDLKELASDIDFEQCKQVSHDDYLKLSKKIKTAKGDIIFARYATIGTLSYVDIDKEFLVSYSCVTIKANSEKLLGTYLYYYFKSDAFFKEVQKQINTNTQGNVGIENLRRVKVILPPLSEQNEIVIFLNNETKKIDDMKEVVKKTIDRFKEYRSTLITQVVTGKIDVRNLQIN